MTDAEHPFFQQLPMRHYRSLMLETSKVYTFSFDWPEFLRRSQDMQKAVAHETTFLQSTGNAALLLRLYKVDKRAKKKRQLREGKVKAPARVCR